MKKILFIAILFIGVLGYGQRFQNGHVDVPMTTTEMNAIVSPEEGQTISNSTTNSKWVYLNGIWREAAGGGISNVVEDLTPQLGGALDGNGFQITNLSGITIASGGLNMTGTGISSVGNIIPNTTLTYGLGNGTFAWDNIYVESIFFPPTDITPSTTKGNVYFDDSESTLKQYNGTAWEALNGAAGGDLWSDPVDSNIVPDTDVAYDLGSSTNYFDYLYSNRVVSKPIAGNYWSTDIITGDHYVWRYTALPTDSGSGLYTLNNTGTPTNATDLIDKAYADANYAGGGSLPVDDTTALVQDPVDNTKTGLIDVGNVATGTSATLSISSDNEFVNSLRINGSGNTSYIFEEGGVVKGQFTYNPTTNYISISNSASSESFRLNDSGGATIFSDVTVNSLIKSGATSDDILLGDGTTTSLAGTARIVSLQSETSETLIDVRVGSTSYLGGLSSPPAGTVALEFPTDDGQAEVIQIACSDLTTDVTTGTTKGYFRMPYAMTLTDVRVSLLTAGTTTGITVDINESGVSVLSTKLTTDATEKTSETATTAAVISDSALADDAEITIDFDAVPTNGQGVIVTLIGTRV